MRALPIIVGIALLTCAIPQLGRAEDRDSAYYDSIISEASKDAHSKWDSAAVAEKLKSAENGNRDAQFTMAQLNFLGMGVPVDSAQGMRWIRKSAASGSIDANRYLASCFFQGVMVTQNPDSCMYYARDGAEQHDGVCEALMGSEILQSPANRADSEKAVMWIELAGLNQVGDFESIYNDLKSHLSPSLIANSDTLARAFLTRRLHKTIFDDTLVYISHLAKLGAPEGEYRLGKIQINSGLTDSVKQAGYLKLEAAAHHGFTAAQIDLGLEYYCGYDYFKKHLDSAAYWYSKAAETYDPEGLIRYGDLFLLGEGVKKNSKEGCRLYKLAAAQNYARAIDKLGWYYWSKYCPNKNKVRAYALMEAAHQRGIKVDFESKGDAMRKMNEKEMAISEQMVADLADSTKVKGIIESFTD